MNYDVNGPFLEFHLVAGDAISTEGRRAAWIHGAVDIKTGVKGSIDLAVDAAAETLFLSTYTCRGEEAAIGFGVNGPGSVIEHPLDAGEKIIARRGVLLAVEPSAKVEIYAQRKMEQQGSYRMVTGPGLALWEILGGGREFILAKDEELLVDSTFLAMYQPSVTMRAARMRGIKQEASATTEWSMMKLRGPGKVWLQSENVRTQGLLI